MSIIVDNISKNYGAQKALDNISFSIKRGEIVGFLGPNGAGKSTLMKILTTYLKSDSGNAIVNDHDIVLNQKKVQKSVGYLPEHNPLYLDLYVREYLAFNADLHKVAKSRIDEVITLTGLTPECHKKIGELSKGYRQRVGLATALLHNPDVLILDEPTTGLDPNQLVEIRELIKNIGKNKTVFLSTHIMQEVEAICDRVIIIDKGKIVTDKKLTNLVSDQTEQIIVVEFDKQVSKAQLTKIPAVRKVQSVQNGWLLETVEEVDLRKEVAQFAQKENWLVLTLKIEQKTLEEVFKELTK